MFAAVHEHHLVICIVYRASGSTSMHSKLQNRQITEYALSRYLRYVLSGYHVIEIYHLNVDRIFDFQKLKMQVKLRNLEILPALSKEK